MNNERFNFWSDKLDKSYSTLSESENYGLGYKLLFSPWSTIDDSEILFLSQNPGKEGSSSINKSISDERGNSYVVEQKTTASPITAQYLKLAQLLRVNPSSILCGVVNPFRSNSWDELPHKMKIEGNLIGKDFWSEVCEQKNFKYIITTGGDASKLAIDFTSASLFKEIPSGWGSNNLKMHRTENCTSIISLPHLSRFKLLSRRECIKPLKEIFQIKPESLFA